VSDAIVATPQGDGPPPVSRVRMGVARAIRGIGWTLIVAGVLVLLYVAYLLWFTNLRTDAAQQDLLDSWQLEFGDPNAALPGEVDEGEAEVEDPAGPGDAYAVMWFTDGETGERILTNDALYVVQGVDVPDLRRGPGHYPDTPGAGADGNFAVSGHRTTYGAPFGNLHLLEEGDVINVIDRDNVRWHYRVRDGDGVEGGVPHRIVAPTDVWVVGDDPLDWGVPMMTLTTCHPRFSARQRLIVFAELDLDYVPPEVVDEELETTTAIEAPRIDQQESGSSTYRPWKVPDVFLLAIAITGFAIARGSTSSSRRAKAMHGMLYVVSFLCLTGVLFASVYPRIESILEDPVLDEQQQGTEA
jgi:sortase A